MPGFQQLLEEKKSAFNSDVEKIRECLTDDSVEQLRVRWLGKKGALTVFFGQLKSAAKADRPLMGKQLNSFRTFLEDQLSELRELAIEEMITRSLAREPLDVSLPIASNMTVGSLHPVSLMRQRSIDVFRQLGFSVQDGPEIENDFYNFMALNIPSDHPARDMQDTFFLHSPKNKSLVLRTHTSNIQIHTMLQHSPPIRCVAPGRVYRVDNDASHSPMFHQLECVVVDKHVSFANLKGLIDLFLKRVFGQSLRTRLRPSFFPFVEPGAEVDLQCTICGGKGCRTCSYTGWLEVGGAGMIHPNVFETVQYDSEVYTGLAFGFGIDRLAMLAFGIPDLRQLFLGDVQLQCQFPVYSN